MRRALHILAAALGLAVASLFALDLRARPRPQPAFLDHLQGVGGPLLAGAAKAEIAVPYPVVAAGYGPRDRHEVRGAAQPQYARAISLKDGDAKLTLVSVDLLEIDSDLLADLKPLLPPAFGDVWVCATHTHTGMGDYDPNLLAQLAGTGRYRPEARHALLEAIKSAAMDAAKLRAPAKLWRAQDELVHAEDRSHSGDLPDPTETRLTFLTEHLPIELVHLAMHPTTVQRASKVLDADYPSALAASVERDGAFGAVFEGALGNVSPSGVSLESLSRGMPGGEPLPMSVLGEVSYAVPIRAEAHLGPRFTRTAAANLIDHLASPREAQLSVARVGPLTFIAVPGEPTADAGRILRKASGDPQALIFGLCNGYVGYVETPDRVAQGSGESERQYFDARLLDDLAHATRLAVSMLPEQPPPPPPPEPPPPPPPVPVIIYAPSPPSAR